MRAEPGGAPIRFTPGEIAEYYRARVPGLKKESGGESAGAPASSTESKAATASAGNSGNSSSSGNSGTGGGTTWSKVSLQ